MMDIAVEWETDEKEIILINGDLLKENLRLLNNGRTLCSAVSGTVAGILGLTGWLFCLLYFGNSMLFSFCSYIYLRIIIKKSPKEFLPSYSILWFHGVLGQLFSFILYWT
jgi:hypothetical protein